MFYSLYLLFPHQPLLNLFKYITFRASAAAITSFLFCVFLYPRFIAFLKAKQIGQSIRELGPQTHFSKKGTPTMGGALMLSGILFSTFLWGNFSNPLIGLMVFVTISFGSIGFIDDWKKVTKKNTKGLSSRGKLALQILFSSAVACYLVYFYGHSTQLSIPFFKNYLVDLGWLYIPFAIFIIVGSSNAVNLTDGLDGLAIGPIMTSALTFAAFAYIAGHAELAHYLQMKHLKDTGELTVFCAAVLAAGAGFLWYNCAPAQIFMGDVGSLCLGAILCVLAILTHQEILLAVVGGIFVIEALSVIIQVISFKSTGRRVFKMSPIHHHFELMGWPETKVVVRFWIVSGILSIIALSTLKIR